LKAVFANKGDRGLQSAPDFAKDQTKWDNFRSADDPVMRGTKRKQSDEAEAEFKLEKELQSFAMNYHKLMKDRASQKKPETLRSLLAFYYQ
jgi:hypothetical protein